ncbi:MAG: copper amine oxidase N-terminal domain-containing protein, partial [Tumebacillaceae bacterium]
MKNRYTATIVGTALFFGGMSTALTPTTALAATTKDHFKIIVEDKLVSYEIQPEFVHDRAFVPLRDLSETLGATVDYDASTQVATLKKDDIVLTLNFKTGVVQKNGTVIKMDEAPRFIRDHALVPLRFISQAFGNEVTYDAKTMTASVLPTQKTLAQRVAISGLLYQVAAASQAKNSYELNLHLQQS